VKNWRAILQVLLPFSAGYFLSYLFRTINALISSQLASELTLGAADLGLLTSIFFLTFAAAQLPIGIVLDRYGPRRVQSALLLIAALGAALFGVARQFPTLVLARALIGLGVAAALTAGFKALALWFPKDRLSSVNGALIMLGALGAVTSTAPVEMLLGWVSWRGLFGILAAVTAWCALFIFLVVPERAAPPHRPHLPAGPALRTVFMEWRFWTLAPLSATCVGTAWGLQGLWAAPWLTDVEGLDRSAVVWHLFIMTVALSAGALGLGFGAGRLRRSGVGPQTLLAMVALCSIAVQLALVMRLQVPSYMCWALVGAVGASTVLSSASIAEYFPQEIVGRANGALGVFDIGGAFLLQFSTGLIIHQWTDRSGHYPAIAYQTAFMVDIALQSAALGWFVLARRRKWRFGVPAPFRELLPTSPALAATRYQKALGVWHERIASAQVQARTWRLAALGSASLLVLLGLTLGAQISQSRVIPYMIEVDRIGEFSLANTAAERYEPSDAQIAHFLARFIDNVRSLSIDPVLVRTKWLRAYDYVTDRAAQALNEYARLAEPFAKIGGRAITVDVISVVRASGNSFEVRWREQTYQNRALVKTEHLTGLVTLVHRLPSTPEMLRNNPLGLYIHSLSWGSDLVGAQEFP
jgi:type IV secretory pathway TrbF-like protein/sugar phosphate permease